MPEPPASTFEPIPQTSRCWTAGPRRSAPSSSRSASGSGSRPRTRSERLLREGRAYNPRLHGPTAGVPPTRLASGRDPTGPRIGRPTGREECIGGGAGNNTAAAYRTLARRAVLLLALRAAAVGHAAPGDQLQPGRSRRSLRACWSRRPGWYLAGREVNGMERGVLHLRRVDCIVLQLESADAVAWQRRGDGVGGAAQRDRESQAGNDQRG